MVGALCALALALAVLGSRSHANDAPTLVRSAPSASVPVGRAGGVWAGWHLRVTSVVPSAAQLLGAGARKTPAGRQDVMVFMTASYTGSGRGRLSDLLGRLYATGTHPIYYEPDSGDLNCTAVPGTSSPRPLNELDVVVPSGHSTRGHLCFLIAQGDADSLALYVDRPGCNTSRSRDNCKHRVWFALRREPA